MIEDKDALLVLRTIDDIKNKLVVGASSFKSNDVSMATKIDKKKIIEIVKYLFDKGLVQARLLSADNVGIIDCYISGITALGNDYLIEQGRLEKKAKNKEKGKKDETELIHGLLDLIDSIPELDLIEIDNLVAKTKMYLKNLYPDSADTYIKDLNRITFSPITSSATNEKRKDVWESGKKRLKCFIERIIEEKKLFGKSEKRGNMKKKNTIKIFITHGHDNDFRNAVELFLKNNNIEVVILEKMVSKGKAIIEKLEQNSDVKCAIVLISPDDELTMKENTIYRARQNVIWEFGFFAGLLSRDKLIFIKNPFTKENKNVTIELPSNMEGLIWINYDKSNRNWKIELSKELNEIGYSVDSAK